MAAGATREINCVGLLGPFLNLKIPMVQYQEFPTNGKNGKEMPVNKSMPKRAELNSRAVLLKPYCVHTSLGGLIEMHIRG